MELEKLKIILKIVDAENHILNLNCNIDTLCSKIPMIKSLWDRPFKKIWDNENKILQIGYPQIFNSNLLIRENEISNFIEKLIITPNMWNILVDMRVLFDYLSAEILCECIDTYLNMLLFNTNILSNENKSDINFEFNETNIINSGSTGQSPWRPNTSNFFIIKVNILSSR
jgi:hypothetical protein